MTFKINSITDLTNFLKRFQSITNTILIEFDGSYLKVKSHTPDKSVVKSSKILLSKIFDVSEVEQSFMIGIYSLDKLIKAFSHFTSENVNFSVKIEQTDDVNVGTEIVLVSPELDINFPCASLKLFSHISDHVLETVIANKSNALVDFVLTKEIQAKITSLGSIDSDQKIITLDIRNGAVYAKGKSYNYNLCSVDTKTKHNISIYKSQFMFLDKEDTHVYVNEDRIVFNSIESETTLAIGKVE